jgi:hypothetical protein
MTGSWLSDVVGWLPALRARPTGEACDRAVDRL